MIEGPSTEDEMHDEVRSRPEVRAPERHPTATILYVEAVGLVAVAATGVGAGAVVTAGLCLVLAAVAGGLAASIAEGLPGSATAVLGFEGATLAFAIMPLSPAAAIAVLAATAAGWFCVHRRRGGVRQIRRPVSCQ